MNSTIRSALVATFMLAGFCGCSGQSDSRKPQPGAKPEPSNVIPVASSPFADEPIEKLVARMGAGNKDIDDEVVRRGDAAVNPLTAVMLDEKANYQIRIHATGLFGRIGGKNVVAPLRTVLTDPNLQWAAVHALGSVGPPAAEAVPDLARIVKAQARRQFAFTCDQAVDALARIGHGTTEAIEALSLRIKARGRGDDAYKAGLALTKLGEHGAEALVTMAVKYLDDGGRPEDERQYGVVYSVLKAGGPLPKEMISVFKKHLLKGGHDAIVAGLALASVGPPAIPVLMELLDDKNPDIRAEAAESLSTMNFNAFCARTYRNEKVADPVSAADVLPKLKKIYKLPGGRVDGRIVQAMIGLDHDKTMADPEILEYLREQVEQALLKEMSKER